MCLFGRGCMLTGTQTEEGQKNPCSYLRLRARSQWKTDYSICSLLQSTRKLPRALYHSWSMLMRQPYGFLRVVWVFGTKKMQKQEFEVRLLNYSSNLTSCNASKDSLNLHPDCSQKGLRVDIRKQRALWREGRCQSRQSHVLLLAKSHTCESIQKQEKSSKEACVRDGGYVTLSSLKWPQTMGNYGNSGKDGFQEPIKVQKFKVKEQFIKRPEEKQAWRNRNKDESKILLLRGWKSKYKRKTNQPPASESKPTENSSLQVRNNIHKPNSENMHDQPWPEMFDIIEVFMGLLKVTSLPSRITQIIEGVTESIREVSAQNKADRNLGSKFHGFYPLSAIMSKTDITFENIFNIPEAKGMVLTPRYLCFTAKLLEKGTLNSRPRAWEAVCLWSCYCFEISHLREQ